MISWRRCKLCLCNNGNELLCAGGETIKSINQQSGAHVELQRNPPPSTDPNTRVFTIRGTAQQMDLARQLIDDKIGVPTTNTPPHVSDHQCQSPLLLNRVRPVLVHFQKLSKAVPRRQGGQGIESSCLESNFFLKTPMQCHTQSNYFNNWKILKWLE